MEHIFKELQKPKTKKEEPLVSIDYQQYDIFIENKEVSVLIPVRESAKFEKN